MKILLYGIYFAPEVTGIGKYTGEMASWLVANGHQVRVFTAPPYHPAWQSGRWQGVTETRYPEWMPRRLKRFSHLVNFAFSSVPALLRQVMWRPQVVWVVEPALFCTPAALTVARLTGAKTWLHVQEFELDTAISLGMLKRPWLRRMALGMERWLMRRFDVVSTVSQRMQQRLVEKGVAPSKTAVAPNWVDVETITPSAYAALALAWGEEPVVNRFRTLLEIDPKTVVALFTGDMCVQQGLELLSQAADLLAQATASFTNAPPIVFVLCGNGTGRADLEMRCAGLPNVRFLDLQPLSLLSELLGMADVHLLPQRADSPDLAIPSKLIGMLASGRPVLASTQPHSELANVVLGTASRGEPCGVIVPPGNALAFAEALLQLAQDPDTRYLMGESARRHAESNLNIDIVLGRFLTRLKSL